MSALERTAATPSRRRALFSDLSLVLVTVIWGTTFPIVKGLLEWMPPFTYMAVRFTLAATSLLLFTAPRVARMRRDDWLAAFWFGLLLFVGLAFQNLGLRITSPTNSAFITAVSVPLTPFAAILVLGSRPRLAEWIGCALAFAGAIVLAYQPGGMLLGPGDLLTLGCAVAWAFEIAVVAKLVPGRDAVALATGMSIVCAALGWVCTLALGERIPPMASLPWPTMLWVGAIAGGLPLIIQNVAQKYTSPVHVALIFALEPIWAALFCYLWLGQEMGPRAWMGSVLILGGILVAELWPQVLDSRR